MEGIALQILAAVEGTGLESLCNIAMISHRIQKKNYHFIQSAIHPEEIEKRKAVLEKNL